MNYIRLKTNLNEISIRDRLQYNPEIIEFYLAEENISDPNRIIRQIRRLHNLGIKVYLHHPPRFRGIYLDIMSEDEEMRAFYRYSSEVLAEICRQEGVRCIVHAHYIDTLSSDLEGRQVSIHMRQRIEEIPGFSEGLFLWEDTTKGLFSYANPYLMEEIIVPLRLPLNVDVSHTFIALKGRNNELEHVMDMTQDYAHYYHLVDSLGQSHDALPLGQGSIDWKMVKPYVQDKDFIFEIGLDGDCNDCSPMIRSAEYFINIRR